MSGREMMEADRPTSPAYQLLAHVWEHGAVFGKSRQRGGTALWNAVQLAITAEMEWGEGDLVWLSEAAGRWRYWTDDGYRVGGGYRAREEDYALACTFRGGPNTSFCQAFEALKDRPPFILRTPDNRSGSRLCVGSTFRWEGERVHVTSFGDDGDHLIACSYGPYEPGKLRTPKRRYTITLEEIREAGREATTEATP